MADIFQQFPIKAPAEAVFQAISTPAGLDTWWTKRSSGQPVEGATYELGFGPGYDWRAVVSRCAPNSVFEVEMTSAVDEWRGTRIGLLLDAGPGPPSETPRASRDAPRCLPPAGPRYDWNTRRRH